MWVVGTVPRSVCGGSHVSMERRWAGAVAVECMSGFVLCCKKQTASKAQQGNRQQLTSMVRAVLPAPLGPTSKNVGSPVALAAFLYRNVCSTIGIRSANATVTRMAMGDGARAHVSQLSSSYHAMVEGDARSKANSQGRRQVSVVPVQCQCSAVQCSQCSGVQWVGWMRPEAQTRRAGNWELVAGALALRCFASVGARSREE